MARLMKEHAVLDGGATVNQTQPKKDPIKEETTKSNDVNYSYTPSADVTNAWNVASSHRDKVLNLPNPMSSVDSNLWNRMVTPYSISPDVQAAINRTNELLTQLESGRTSYTDQISSLIDEITNRDAFTYNPDDDMLFQNALASAMDSGKIAMQDTMGQAAALTGGYGSTYATAAANGTYNQYIQDAYDQLPEYYQMAMNAYNLEGDQMLTDLGVLTDADAREYERMYKAWTTNYQNAVDMYNRDFSEWSADVQQAQNAVGFQYDAAVQRNNQQINAFSAAQEYAEALYAQEYGKWQDEVSLLIDQQEAEYERQKAAAEEASYKTPTDKMFDGAVEAYNAGGEEGFLEYASKYPDYDVESLYDYAVDYGQSFEKTKDTWNGLWGVDWNDEVTDQKGNVYTLRELQKQGMSRDDLLELTRMKVK